uniref:Uncharacterized protein n=1 Tax=Fagus sylvatica TaxID=28930 RepID=A0A2N9HEY4_FAGSY
MAKTKKTQGKLARYVNTPEAMARFRRHYGVPDDVYLEYRFWENAITGEPGDLIIPVVAIIEGGGMVFPWSPVPTKDGKPEEKKKQIQSHLTDPVALQAVYDSEVCVDEYANPRSAYKLLRYIPSARSFLQCRQVSNLAEALANPANKSPPAHDIRAMAGINLKKLLPPRPQAETSEPILPLKRKRKGAPKGGGLPGSSSTKSWTLLLRGLLERPSSGRHPGRPWSPRAPSLCPQLLRGAGPFCWHVTLGVLGDAWTCGENLLRTVLAQHQHSALCEKVSTVTGGSSSTASALCEVARLPVDMDVWRKSTNQEVINNLRRGLMMRQTADLENSLRVATRSVHLKSESELEEGGGGQEEDLLRNALEENSKAGDSEEENSKAGERIQALEAEIAARERRLLTGGWKALYSWESDDMPPLPPQEVFPYPNAPLVSLGVPEEELPEPQPADDDVAGPSNS